MWKLGMLLGNLFWGYDLKHECAATYPHFTWASMGNCVHLDFSIFQYFRTMGFMGILDMLSLTSL